MATTLSVRSVCSKALEKIGSFSLRDSGADPDEMERAVEWLDLVVASLAGVKRCQWLVPQTFEFALDANTESYLLSDLAGADWPADGILFPIEAWIRDPGGRDTSVELIRRRQYEDIEDKDSAGLPNVIHVDRLNGDDKNIYIHPVPASTGYSLRLIAQTYSPSYTTNVNQDAEIPHGFSPEWQLYLITALSAEIGDGPVRRLPMQEVNAMRTRAAQLLVELTESNRETVSKPRRSAAWGA